MKTSHKLAPYFPSHPKVRRVMLDLADLKTGDILYDAAAGHGEITFDAAKIPDIHIVAIELAEKRANYIKREVARRGLEKRIEVIHGSILDVDMSTADVVTLYLTRAGNESIRPKLENELSEDAKVVSEDFPFLPWKQTKLEFVIVPADYHAAFMPIYFGPPYGENQAHQILLYEMRHIHD
jgi:16S rRNA A1518/A1519 N6-dimethyltransferase RsmA/KsgA/DIM1 with predicted DNA glycosylase/AP lyase activity